MRGSPIGAAMMVPVNIKPTAIKDRPRNVASECMKTKRGDAKVASKRRQARYTRANAFP